MVTYCVSSMHHANMCIHSYASGGTLQLTVTVGSSASSDPQQSFPLSSGLEMFLLQLHRCVMTLQPRTRRCSMVGLTPVSGSHGVMDDSLDCSVSCTYTAALTTSGQNLMCRLLSMSMILARWSMHWVILLSMARLLGACWSCEDWGAAWPACSRHSQPHAGCSWRWA